jgi:hypothetical protein
MKGMCSKGGHRSNSTNTVQTGLKTNLTIVLWAPITDVVLWKHHWKVHAPCPYINSNSFQTVCQTPYPRTALTSCIPLTNFLKEHYHQSWRCLTIRGALKSINSNGCLDPKKWETPGSRHLRWCPESGWTVGSVWKSGLVWFFDAQGL